MSKSGQLTALRGDMPLELLEIIDVRIDEQDDGLLVAVSDDLPGLLVVDRDMEALLEEIPKVISALVEAKYGKKYQVRPARRPIRDRRQPWVAIPAHIAGQAMPAE